MEHDDIEAYDKLLAKAAYANGVLATSAKAAARARELLLEAKKAGHEWAQIQLDRATLEGLREDVKRHLKRTNVTTEKDDRGTHERSKVYSVLREDAAGVKAYQPSFFEDMTVDDLTQLITRSEALVRSNRQNRATARKLRKLLLDHPEAATVRDALSIVGKTLEEVLSA